MGAGLSRVNKEGKTNLTADVKWLRELDMDHRVQGDSVWFKLAVLIGSALRTQGSSRKSGSDRPSTAKLTRSGDHTCMRTLALRLEGEDFLRLLTPVRLSASVIVLCMLPCLLTGCTAVGPRSIKAGRLAYAEAINQTQDEQILLAIVKGRYGESTTLLTVSSVVANLRFRAELGIEGGFNGAGAPGDDLLIGGIAYEENPTISYAPVQGEDYTRQLMSPVPLDLLLPALRSSTTDARVLGLLVNRINDLRNPDFLPAASSRPGPGFMRLVELFSELRKAGALDLVQGDEQGVAFKVWLDPRGIENTANIAEFLDLLGLSNGPEPAKPMAIPVYFGIRADESWKIGMTTRSTFELLEIMRSAVRVPEAHAAAGLTVTYPPSGPAGPAIRIQSSPRKPGGRSLAVKYRGYWFWIAETDLETKAVFRLLRTLWSISMASSTSQAPAPVLTLPVGN